MKTCPNCNTDNADDVLICKKCGASLPGKQTYSSSSHLVPSENAEGVIPALICGIISLIPLCCFGLVLGIIAVIMGFKALNRIEKNPELQGKKMATLAIILGIIGIILNTGIIIFWNAFWWGYYY